MINIKKGSLMQKSSIFAAAFALALSMNGCSDDSSSAKKFTPFERIATLDVEKDATGAVDYVATYAKTKAVAKAIHNYIESTDETSFTHDDDTAYPANWIIAGQETFDDDPATVEGILNIPSPDRIDPAADASPENTYKVQVMDICNSYYAKKALGVTDIVTDQKVANGFIHAPALPCEVTVYNDGTNVYVDMLNPDAIFTLFFSDTVFGTQMADTDFADEISKLPGTVKTELKSIVYAALDDASYTYKALSKKIGPAYTQAQILDTVDDSPYDSPYLHYAYMKDDSSDFTTAEVSQVAQRIIDTMSIHGTTVEGRIDGEHEADLESLLSAGSSWRSARPEALGLPGTGGYKNWVIEACSPKYAKQAMGTGRHHAGALPCEISVTAIESTAGAGRDTLVISFLEPGFMFTALFKDAFDAMSADELATYAALPPAVLADLQEIVDYAVETDLPEAATPMTLVAQGRKIYDMMPAQ